MLSRDDALILLDQAGTSPSLLRHALASEAVLRALALRLAQDDDLWAMTGLLHDLDFPATEASPQEHGLKSAEMLAGKLPPEALNAIMAHNSEMNGTEPREIFDFALRCGESVTGLIAAAALMRPTGYEGMQAKSIKKKMKDKAFAANVNRENIRECQKIGIELDDFLTLAIDAMSKIPAQNG